MQDEAAHILVVDDDDRLRDLLRRFLSGHGYRITTAANADDAAGKMRGLAFDLLVLDIMMPGQTGLEFTRDLRRHNDVPVLLLTAMGETSDRIEGLSAGADDYLGKPFEPEELLLRIQAILKRVGQIAKGVGNGPAGDPDETPIGNMLFDGRTNILVREDTEIRLTQGEADLLKFFCRQPGTIVSRDALQTETGSGSDRAVDVGVTRLRRKLETDPKNPRYLQTVRGAGYVLYTD